MRDTSDTKSGYTAPLLTAEGTYVQPQKAYQAGEAKGAVHQLYAFCDNGHELQWSNQAFNALACSGC